MSTENVILLILRQYVTWRYFYFLSMICNNKNTKSNLLIHGVNHHIIVSHVFELPVTSSSAGQFVSVVLLHQYYIWYQTVVQLLKVGIIDVRVLYIVSGN